VPGDSFRAEDRPLRRSRSPRQGQPLTRVGLLLRGTASAPRIAPYAGVGPRAGGNPAGDGLPRQGQPLMRSQVPRREQAPASEPIPLAEGSPLHQNRSPTPGTASAPRAAPYVGARPHAGGTLWPPVADTVTAQGIGGVRSSHGATRWGRSARARSPAKPGFLRSKKCAQMKF
jgi:hypothetical protein